MQHVIDVGIASDLENKDLLSHPFFAASAEVAVKTTPILQASPSTNQEGQAPYREELLQD